MFSLNSYRYSNSNSISNTNSNSKNITIHLYYNNKYYNFLFFRIGPDYILSNNYITNRRLVDVHDTKF